MLINKVIFMSSLAFNLFIRLLLLSSIISSHRSRNISSLHLGLGDFDVLSPLLYAIVFVNHMFAEFGPSGFLALRMGNDMRPVKYKFIHNLIPTTFLETIWSGPNINGLIFLVVVGDGTSFLPTSLAVLCEIWTEWHNFYVQPGPIIHSYITFQKTNHNCIRTPRMSTWRMPFEF